MAAALLATSALLFSGTLLLLGYLVVNFQKVQGGCSSDEDASGQGGVVKAAGGGREGAEAQAKSNPLAVEAWGEKGSSSGGGSGAQAGAGAAL